MKTRIRSHEISYICVFLVAICVHMLLFRSKSVSTAELRILIVAICTGMSWLVLQGVLFIWVRWFWYARLQKGKPPVGEAGGAATDETGGETDGKEVVVTDSIYRAVDPAIRQWASDHQLTLYTRDRDWEVRTVDVARTRWRLPFVIWVDAPRSGMVGVHASDRGRARFDREVPVADVGGALDEALAWAKART